MKKILITGGAGFLGINLYNFLKSKGYQVVLLDIEDRMRRLRNSKFDGELIKCNLGVDPFVCPKDIDVVIHLAAWPHVDYSYYEPKRTLKNNINSLIDILESIKNTDTSVILASSVEVYSSDHEMEFTEEYIPKPVSPYGISKTSCESILENYNRCYGIPYKIFRLTNLFGAYQLPDRIIPRTISRFLNDLPIEVDDSYWRDFLYVDDACSAIEKLINSSKYSELYNISTGVNTSIVDIAKLISETIGYGEVVVNEKSLAGKQRYNKLMINNKKIITDLNWEPKISLPEGIKKTIDWYSTNSEWYKQFEKSYSSSRKNKNFIIDCYYQIIKNIIRDIDEELIR